MNWYDLFVSFTGRISRGQFWAGLLALLAVELLVFLPLAQIFGDEITKRPAPLWFRNLTLLMDTVLVWPTLAVLVKRQRDRDQTGHLSYLAVVCAIAYSAFDAFGLITTAAGVTAFGYAAGVVSVGILAVLIFELGVRSGVEHTNRYGEEPVV